jgi:hypothetical protein
VRIVTEVPRRSGQPRSFLDIEGCNAGIDAIHAADRQQATQLAATHPLARDHAIEVEQYYAG